MSDILLPPAPTTPKRAQVLDGARKVFLAKGFDAASVNDVAQEAGVSKATLYAYFPSKEKLFEALVAEDRRRQAERVFEGDADQAPAPVLLKNVGLRLVRAICQPDSIAYTRLVISIAPKFPEIGRAFFLAGPAFAVRKLTTLLEARTASGELNIQDAELAANQFLDLCLSGIMKPVMFAFRDLPADYVLAARVDQAVAMFMCRYGVKP